ncbi:RluA family pseudouridine synthase [Planctomycetota bacterium]
MARKPKSKLSPGYGEEPTEFRVIRLELRHQPKIRRVDNFLSQHYSQFSRSYFQKLIRAGELIVNGTPVTVSHRLQKGDVIECKLPVLPERVTKPQPIPLDILYEDDDIFVICKPAGIICHPGRKDRENTLANAFIYHMHGMTEGSHNPGIVHRLDADTTGTMVVAKNPEAHAALARQFERRTVHKEYVALVRGRIKRRVGRIDTPIGYNPKRWGLMMVGPEARRPKPSASVYRVLERFRDYTFVSIVLKTGRTHQIRVHFESINHPVVADRYYRGDLGPDPLEAVIPRLALHAWKLRIIHPTKGGPMDFTAPLPADMAAALEHLRKERGTAGE